MNAQAFIREPTSAEVDTEQAVIALLMEGPEAAWRVLDRVSREDFLEPLHQRIVDAARRILDAGSTITALTLGAAMSADPGLNEMGGADYFRKLKITFPRNTDIANELCAALADNAQRRAIASVIAEAESQLRDVSTTAGDVAASLTERIQALQEGRAAADDPVSWYDAGRNALETADAAYAGLGRKLLPYGIPAIDLEIGGMGPGDLVILAGRPGMGKSAIATAISHCAARAGHGVYFVSQEMSAESLAHRGLSMRARDEGRKIPYNLMRLGKINDQQRDVLAKVLVDDSGLALQIDQRRGMTVAQIGVRARRAQARFAKAGKPLGLIVIDHLGLIEASSDYRNNRVAEVTQMTRAIKTMAGTVGVPVLLLCQLNRLVEGREDKRPQLSDLRESGSIEQDADVVIFAHREEYYLKKHPPKDSAKQEDRAKYDIALMHAADKLDLAVAKNRHGAEAMVTVNFEIAYNWIS